MHIIDWLIMILPLLICAVIAIYSPRFVRSVADFMAGCRNAGRFLICTARAEQGAGPVVLVALFQMGISGSDNEILTIRQVRKRRCMLKNQVFGDFLGKKSHRSCQNGFDTQEKSY